MMCKNALGTIMMWKGLLLNGKELMIYGEQHSGVQSPKLTKAITQPERQTGQEPDLTTEAQVSFLTLLFPGK